MEQELRTRLVDELSAGSEPPIGDLVTASLRQGQRLRMTRRLRYGAVALLVVAVTVGLAGGRAALGPPAQVGAPALAEQLVPATPAGLLALLEELLPEGATSGYAGTDDGQLMVQVYLDTGRGPGMLRVAVGTDNLSAKGGGQAPAVTVTELPDNCVQRTVVQHRRPDGVSVQVNIASCLAWDGTTNPVAPQALTVEQAKAVAADPRWGVMIPRSLVDAGQAQHPDLPELA
ncbi:hypothetical protein AB0K00_52855 [Dactylosporangium sp. NPDC049525]|uniref:hypothetical protein n=1 Tax=Dactylosporangium sp. NPDC049525 TaxID=3154730 RepID=UPI003416214E